MRILILALFAILLVAPPGTADQWGRPDQAALDAVTERGRMLAQYDRAASYATDAVQATSPDNDKVRRYIAVKEKTGWKVLFGRLNASKQTFLVAYEATAKDAALTSFAVKANPVPLANTGFPFSAAKAMDLALTVFKGDRRPYNIAALPAPNGQIWVYVFPAQTKANSWPLGGDTRYLLSSDGGRIIATRQLHKSILDFAAPPDGAKPAAGYHSAILDDVPEDTDVSYVLSRRPSIPEYVLTKKFGYMIKPDGSISYIGTRAALEKKMMSP